MSPASPCLTVRDYAHLPNDGQRHEIVAGLHLVTPSPKMRHQEVSMRLSRLLGEIVDELGGHLLAAPADVVLSEIDVVQPDLLWVARGGLAKMTEANVKGPPDLVVEIASKSTRAVDKGPKRDLYERSGVREYWVVEPEFETVTVWDFSSDAQNRSRSVAAGELLRSHVLGDIEIALEEILRLA